MRPRRPRWNSPWRPGPARSIESAGLDTIRRAAGNRRAGHSCSRARARKCAGGGPRREPLQPRPAGPGDYAHHSSPESGDAGSDSDARSDGAATRDQRHELREWRAQRHRRCPDRTWSARCARRNHFLHLARCPQARPRSGRGGHRRGRDPQRLEASPEAPEAKRRRAPPAQARPSALRRRGGMT